MKEYDILKQQIVNIEEHSKEYEHSLDKKNFLTTITPYEQKYILINSKNTYEVLKLLDEINSNIVLNDLSGKEASIIMSKLTNTQLLELYNTFDNKFLVNFFIRYDRNNLDFINSIPLERRLDLLKSANDVTVSAASKLYSSLPYSERMNVMANILNYPHADTIMRTIGFKQDYITQKLRNEIGGEIITPQGEKIKIENLSFEQLKNMYPSQCLNIAENLYKSRCLEYSYKTEIDNFFHSYKEYYEKSPEFEGIKIQNTSFSNLPYNLQTIIRKDYYNIISDKTDYKKFGLDEAGVFLLKEQALKKNYLKSEKSIKHIELMLNSSLRDFSVYMEKIRLYDYILSLSLNEKRSNEHISKYPELSNLLSKYLSTEMPFARLDIEEQNEILNIIGNSKESIPGIEDALNKTQQALNQEAKNNINILIKQVYNEDILKKTDILNKLNIHNNKTFENLTEEEKKVIINFINNEPKYRQLLNQINEKNKNMNINVPCVKDNISKLDILLTMEDDCDMYKFLSDAYVADFFNNRLGADENGMMETFSFQGLDCFNIVYRGQGNAGRQEGMVGISKVQLEQMKQNRRIFDENGNFIATPEVMFVELGGVNLGERVILLRQKRKKEEYFFATGGLEGLFRDEWFFGGVTSGFKSEIFTHRVNMVFNYENIDIEIMPLTNSIDGLTKEEYKDQLNERMALGFFNKYVGDVETLKNEKSSGFPIIKDKFDAAASIREQEQINQILAYLQEYYTSLEMYSQDQLFSRKAI